MIWGCLGLEEFFLLVLECELMMDAVRLNIDCRLRIRVFLGLRRIRLTTEAQEQISVVSRGIPVT